MSLFSFFKPELEHSPQSENAAIIDFGRSAAERKRLAKIRRDAELAERSVPGKLVYLASHHKIICAFAILLVALSAFCVMLISTPSEAEALPGIAMVPIISDIAGALGFDVVTNGIAELLKSAINGVLAGINAMLQSLASADVLTKNFSELFSAVYPVVYEIHHSAVIPIANVVLIIFLLVGLGKVVQEMNRSDTGVDLWALMWVFIAYAFAKVIIDASFELMVLAYNVVLALITNVSSVAQSMGAMNPLAGETGFVGDDIKNAGVLLTMLFFSLIAFLVTIFVFLGAHAAVIARAAQIYVYTCFSPIPLAFLVSESSRQMATGFIKKYLAVLFAGAIMILLFVMMSAMINGVALTDVDPTDDLGIVNWYLQMLYSLVSIVAFGICIFRSGAWARDFVGL